MNIKQQIKALVDRDHSFGSDFSWNANDEFKQIIFEYLDKSIFDDAVESAKKLIQFVLSQHEKNRYVEPILDLLKCFELGGHYSYEQQRVHYIHQLNVFLLGLYLYQIVPDIKSSIAKEMKLTTTDLNLGIDQDWRYSGETPYGEFLYRWRLSSLSHDLGYLISLNKKGTKKIIDMVNKVLCLYETKISKIEDIWMFEGINLLDQLDGAIPEVSIKEYMNYQSKSPLKGEVYYDHGIISALILLRLMNEAYAKHNQNGCLISTKVVWHPSFLTSSVLQAAVAVALHNLEQYEEALKACTKYLKIFDMNKRPLSWLLKIADTLQEWDKPLAKQKNLSSTILDCGNYGIFYHNEKILAEHFPKEKKDEVNNILQQYTYPSNIVCVK